MTIILETLVVENLENQPIIMLGFEGVITAEAVLEGYMKSMEFSAPGTHSNFRIIDVRNSNADYTEILKVLRAAVMITSSKPIQAEKSIIFVGTLDARDTFASSGFTFFDDMDDALAHSTKQLKQFMAIA